MEQTVERIKSRYQSAEETKCSAAFPIRYCLYARKSSEDDERQALSIDSQTKEMLALAERDGLTITDIRQEGHSAKESGQRPVYNQLLQDVRSGIFNGILTWAADRLSRNAGDLGSIVDLMDQGRLHEIRTQGQRFSNSPNEKFLLMILCSQAKLENDNKSVNVKRGLRAKVEMGYRPNKPPLGYLHDKFAEKGDKKIFLDPLRAPIIKQMFEYVGRQGWSGRRIKKWLDDDVKFTTRSGKKVSLSSIYLMLQNTFYTGRFEFPAKSGIFYPGKHEPLIPQDLFDRVHENLNFQSHYIPGSKEFTFTHLFVCGACSHQVIAEEKSKHLKDGSLKKYVYYHCSQTSKGCKEPAIREEELIEQLCGIIDQVDIDELKTAEGIKEEIEKLKGLMSLMATQGGMDRRLLDNLPKIDPRAYVKMILKQGKREEKRDTLKNLKSQLSLREKNVLLANKQGPVY